MIYPNSKTPIARCALRISLSVLLASLALGGCDSSMDKANAELAAGRQLLEQGDAKQASERFLAVIQADGANVEAIFLRGRALEAQQKWSEAYGHYLRAIDLKPDEMKYALAALDLEVRAGQWDKANTRLQGLNLDAAQRSVWEARIAAGQRNWAKADQLYAKVINDTDIDQEVLVDAADVALRMGGADERASLMIDRALARDPNDRHARLLRAQIDIQKGNDRNAAQRLQSLFDEDAGDTATALKLGALRVRMNQSDAAIAVYRRYLEENPGEQQITLAYGELLARLGRFDKLKQLVGSIDVSSERSEGLRDYLQGLATLGAGNPREAEEPLRKATLLLADNPGVWFAYGQATFAAGNRATAMLAYDKALKLAPGMLAAELQSARIELLELNTRAAKVRIKRLAKAYPDNVQVMALGIRAELLDSHHHKALDKANEALLGKPGNAQLLALKATALSRLDRDEDALAIYRQLIAAGDHAAHADAARILERLGRSDEARALLSAAGSDNNADDLAARGVLELRAGHQKAARELMQKALALDPNQLQANLNLAMMKVTAGDLDGAKPLLDTALAVSPKDPLVHQTLGLIAQARVELDQAEAQYREALAADSSMILSRVGLAEVQLALGRPLEAINTARKALELNPKSERALLALGSGHAALGELKRARKALDQVLEINPENIEALVQRGRVALRMHDNQAALDDFDKGLELDARQGAALIGRLDALMLLGRADEAMADLDTRLSKTPDNLLLLRLKGTLMIRAGHGADAIGILKKVLDAAPDNPASALLLARAQVAAGQPGAAMGTLKGAEAKATAPLPLRMYRAQIADESGDLATAIETYRAVLSAVPDYPAALNNLAWALHRNGDAGGEALKLARRAYTLDAGSVSVADTLGVLLTANDQARQAVGILDKAASKAPNSTLIQLHLAQALAASGDRKRARKVLGPLLADGVAEQAAAQTLDAKLRAE